ncbi:hypothetical protein PoB_000995500 [Plakobranchus ocellatus]|uniref:Uncharacterized protein n=1 Tax=Plakobranchus ocellatus TaxID=259542 RepID=A0AAV3YK34_9GAST|nr:hypothetical protein PoB_000995500 [Plakobranchus ocellatus]
MATLGDKLMSLTEQISCPNRCVMCYLVSMHSQTATQQFALLGKESSKLYSLFKRRKILEFCPLDLEDHQLFRVMTISFEQNENVCEEICTRTDEKISDEDESCDKNFLDDSSELAGKESIAIDDEDVV